MVILAIVQFEGKTKEYAFLTALDTIKEGARVKDKRYDKPFTVKRTDFHFSTTYAGYPLKWITSSTIEWIETPSTRFNNNQTSNNMEKRNITVSLEEAKNWYNGKDQTLRRLALQAYTEKELREPHNFEEVLGSLEIHSIELEMKLEHKEDSSPLKLLKEHRGCIVLAADEEASICAVIGRGHSLIPALASAIKSTPNFRDILAAAMMLDMIVGGSKNDTDED